MENKSPLYSKTLWFNTLSILALFIADIVANSEIRATLGGKIFWIMIFGSFINVILRFYTDKPIVIKKTKPPSTNPLEEAIQADDDYIKDF